MRRFFRENGLSIVLLVFFLAFWLFGQAVAGHRESNKERVKHGYPERNMKEYLMSPHFLEATSENWESEFLQMGVYVALTVFLFQKGSAESKDPDALSSGSKDQQNARPKSQAPWPVRRGGWILKIYKHSLTLAFLLLFLTSFAIHLVSGSMNYNEERAMEGERPITVLQYLAGSRFWFESLQNWQSEFLAILSMVVLSIFLRQQGSPESKPVDAPHFETSDE